MRQCLIGPGLNSENVELVETQLKSIVRDIRNSIDTHYRSFCGDEESDIASKELEEKKRE